MSDDLSLVEQVGLEIDSRLPELREEILKDDLDASEEVRIFMAACVRAAYYRGYKDGFREEGRLFLDLGIAPERR